MEEQIAYSRGYKVCLLFTAVTFGLKGAFGHSFTFAMDQGIRSCGDAMAAEKDFIIIRGTLLFEPALTENTLLEMSARWNPSYTGSKALCHVTWQSKNCHYQEKTGCYCIAATKENDEYDVLLNHTVMYNYSRRMLYITVGLNGVPVQEYMYMGRIPLIYDKPDITLYVNASPVDLTNNDTCPDLSGWRRKNMDFVFCVRNLYEPRLEAYFDDDNFIFSEENCLTAQVRVKEAHLQGGYRFSFEDKCQRRVVYLCGFSDPILEVLGSAYIIHATDGSLCLFCITLSLVKNFM